MSALLDAPRSCPCGYRGPLRSFRLADGGLKCPGCGLVRPLRETERPDDLGTTRA